MTSTDTDTCPDCGSPDVMELRPGLCRPCSDVRYEARRQLEAEGMLRQDPDAAPGSVLACTPEALDAIRRRARELRGAR